MFEVSNSPCHYCCFCCCREQWPWSLLSFVHFPPLKKNGFRGFWIFQHRSHLLFKIDLTLSLVTLRCLGCLPIFGFRGDISSFTGFIHRDFFWIGYVVGSLWNVCVKWNSKQAPGEKLYWDFKGNPKHFNQTTTFFRTGSNNTLIWIQPIILKDDI